MAVSLGATLFDDLKGPPPRLAEVGVELYTRPGTINVGGRITAGAGIQSEITLVRFVADSSRISTAYGYRSLKGTVVAFTHAGVNYATTYGYNFLVVDMEIVESKTLARAVGVGPSGSAFNYAPAGKIVSKWTLVAVPSS